MANLDQVLRQLQQQAGYAAGEARKALTQAQASGNDSAMARRELEQVQRDLQNLKSSLQSVKLSGQGGYGGGPQVEDHIRYIESIPGRRVPFDMLVSIPIDANVTTAQQGTLTVSQDGPFIATTRFAAFQSAFQFSKTVNGAVAAFQGHSYGRWRPIHSMWDNFDAGAGVFQPIAGLASPGTGAGIYASPSNHSSFRSMEWDGVINFLNQGSAYPRSNNPVPSAFWTSQVNAPFNLGALDFFERGETMQWQVTPTHVNNPSAGNVNGFAAPAGSPYPFIDSQYDVHEGVLDPADPNATSTSTDPITRLPQGILVIGFHGFRIIQPPGPVAMS